MINTSNVNVNAVRLENLSIKHVGEYGHVYILIASEKRILRFLKTD